ncbi:hypothetical protein C8R47DRAFT_1070034 [Mycena vitilis]|nr:hypothetical protein C8R47DRAFT_1070034 [Mycena vitilis]
MRKASQTAQEKKSTRLEFQVEAGSRTPEEFQSGVGTLSLSGTRFPRVVAFNRTVIFQGMEHSPIRRGIRYFIRVPLGPPSTQHRARGFHRSAAQRAEKEKIQVAGNPSDIAQLGSLHDVHLLAWACLGLEVTTYGVQCDVNGAVKIQMQQTARARVVESWPSCHPQKLNLEALHAMGTGNAIRFGDLRYLGGPAMLERLATLGLAVACSVEHWIQVVCLMKESQELESPDLDTHGLVLSFFLSFPIHRGEMDAYPRDLYTLDPLPPWNFDDALHPFAQRATHIDITASLDHILGRNEDEPLTTRRRTGQACGKCRTRKVKCSGDQPSCERCASRGFTCEYREIGRVRGPNKPKSDAAPTASTSPKNWRPSPYSLSLNEHDGYIPRRSRWTPRLPLPTSHAVDAIPLPSSAHVTYSDLNANAASASHINATSPRSRPDSFVPPFALASQSSASPQYAFSHNPYAYAQYPHDPDQPFARLDVPIDPRLESMGSVDDLESGSGWRARDVGGSWSPVSLARTGSILSSWSTSSGSASASSGSVDGESTPHSAVSESESTPFPLFPWGEMYPPYEQHNGYAADPSTCAPRLTEEDKHSLNARMPTWVDEEEIDGEFESGGESGEGAGTRPMSQEWWNEHCEDSKSGAESLKYMGVVGIHLAYRFEFWWRVWPVGD